MLIGHIQKFLKGAKSTVGFKPKNFFLSLIVYFSFSNETHNFKAYNTNSLYFAAHVQRIETRSFCIKNNQKKEHTHQRKGSLKNHTQRRFLLRELIKKKHNRVNKICISDSGPSWKFFLTSLQRSRNSSNRNGKNKKKLSPEKHGVILPRWKEKVKKRTQIYPNKRKDYVGDYTPVRRSQKIIVKHTTKKTIPD